LGLIGRHALASARIDFSLLDPLQQSLRRAAYLRGDRRDSRPQRGVFAPLLLDHPNGPLVEPG
jgi:hypothetical protein